MTPKQKIALFVFVGFILLFYYLNYYTNNMVLTTLSYIPKIIAFLFAMSIMIFPRDYEKVPEILSMAI